MVVGTAWPVNCTYTKADEAVDAVHPVGGGDRLGGHVDDLGERPNPNCMLKWMDWTLQPDVQAEVGIYYGAAGSNVDSCAEIASQLGKGGEELVTPLEYGFCGDADFLDLAAPVEDAGGDLRGRPRGHLCRLLAVDPGLDRDHGLLGPRWHR